MGNQFTVNTRTTHSYDASRHSKCHAARMGCAAQVSGVARLVGVQRTVQKNGNVKNEAEYLACEEPPIVLSTFDSTLSCSSVALLASTTFAFFCL